MIDWSRQKGSPDNYFERKGNCLLMRPDDSLDPIPSPKDSCPHLQLLKGHLKDPNNPRYIRCKKHGGPCLEKINISNC